ncbi:hypothetical protein pipiens_012167 [Culex pipiens pipiens]|uniref:Uncharacterized protein n=1 Tax=Culex pipiens pipiens TaxID=38569 RepID=A0ABD1D3F2_CULPP
MDHAEINTIIETLNIVDLDKCPAIAILAVTWAKRCGSTQQQSKRTVLLFDWWFPPLADDGDLSSAEVGSESSLAQAAELVSRHTSWHYPPKRTELLTVRRRANSHRKRIA